MAFSQIFIVSSSNATTFLGMLKRCSSSTMDYYDVHIALIWGKRVCLVQYTCNFHVVRGHAIVTHLFLGGVIHFEVSYVWNAC